MSTNWSPTRITGLSEFIALWKTIETLRHRYCRSSSRDFWVRSSPRKTMLPPTSLAGGRRICMTAFATVLLPQPYSTASCRSATSASRGRVVAIASAIGSTTFVTLRALLRTSRELTHEPPRSAHRAQPRIAHLVDAGEDERQPEHRDPDRETREHERPPLALEHARVDRRPVQRDAPARLAHVTEAEELEPGIDKDRDVEDEHECSRDPADHVR